MKMILKTAKEKGYKKAVAQIRTENTASIKLHEKNGLYKSRQNHK